MKRTVYIWRPTRLEPEALATGPHIVYPKANPKWGEETYCGRRLLSHDISSPYDLDAIIHNKIFCADCIAAYVAEELRSEDIRDADG